MLQLHYHPGNASLIPHLVLEELGAPFELAFVDRSVAAHKSADYLKLNPNGLIPVLVDRREAFGGAAKPLVLYETAAVCLHLADTHAQAALMPPLGSVERANAYKWLAWLANTVQAALIVYFYPERWADDAGAVAQVKAHAEAKVGAMLDQLDAEFARHGRPWLLGDASASSIRTRSSSAAGRAASRGRRATCRTCGRFSTGCWRARRCSACSRARA